MNIRSTPRLGSTTIDGAVCEAWRDSDGGAYLRYQARRGEELKFFVNYMLKADDGYTGETIWATSAEAAFDLVRNQMPTAHFPSDAAHADLGRDLEGWSPEQIGRAVVWASDLSDGVLQIAINFSPPKAA